MKRLQSKTVRFIADVFDRLDYRKLGPIYCDEGGEEFWKDRRDPCQTLGKGLAEIVLNRLKPGGRSLYVGVGVAELPVLITEVLELDRHVEAFNLREDEVAALNHACKGLPFRIAARDARSARGMYDHLWIVSVLTILSRIPSSPRSPTDRRTPSPSIRPRLRMNVQRSSRWLMPVRNHCAVTRHDFS